MVSVGRVTVTRSDVKLPNPLAEAVMVYVPVVVGVPMLAVSEIAVFWWRITSAGVTVTMLDGEPVTVKWTAMSVLATSQFPHPGVFGATVMTFGTLRVVREVAT